MIRINEETLRRIIAESAIRYINEMYEEGCDEGKFGEWLGGLFKDAPLQDTVEKELSERFPDTFIVEPTKNLNKVNIKDKLSAKPIGFIADAGEFYTGNIVGSPSIHDRSLKKVIDLSFDGYKKKMMHNNMVAEAVSRVIKRHLL